MNRMNEFDNILNECIERVLKGEPVEKCITTYPEHAAELKPLLETVMETRRAVDVIPRPEFRQRAGRQFQDAIRETTPVKRGFFRAHQAWVTAIAAILAVLMIGTGTVAAAGNSLPDSPLYTVKTAAESVRLALTPSEEGKTELYASFADERVAEIVKMAEQGKTEEVEKSTARMDKQFIAMASLTASEGETGIVEEAPVRTMKAPAPTAPTPEPAPAPKAATAPPPLAPPAPVIEPPPAVDIGEEPTVTMFAVANATGPVEDAALREKGIAPGQSKLKEKISRQAEKNRRELEEALQKSPKGVRDAVEKALEVAGRGYDNALKKLK